MFLDTVSVHGSTGIALGFYAARQVPFLAAPATLLHHPDRANDEMNDDDDDEGEESDNGSLSHVFLRNANAAIPSRVWCFLLGSSRRSAVPFCPSRIHGPHTLTQSFLTRDISKPHLKRRTEPIVTPHSLQPRGYVSGAHMVTWSSADPAGTPQSGLAVAWRSGVRLGSSWLGMRDAGSGVQRRFRTRTRIRRTTQTCEPESVFWDGVFLMTVFAQEITESPRHLLVSFQVSKKSFRSTAAWNSGRELREDLNLKIWPKIDTYQNLAQARRLDPVLRSV